MKIVNTTKNQHFISQAEQRLNSCSLGASKRNQKIYAFNIINREQHNIVLENPKGVSIESNLSFVDLFSFDVVDKEYRANFEELFKTYESKIDFHTKTLLSKLQGGDDSIKEQLIELFAAKLLNSFRNPYCIEKTINTIGRLSCFQPTSPIVAEIYERIERGYKPHLQHVCNTLGVSGGLYIAWMKSLFMLFMPAGENTLLELLIRSLYDKDSHYLSTFVFTYTDECADKGVLISDRSFSSPSADDSCLAYSFNLSKNAFISYVFLDVDEQTLVPAPERVLKKFKQSQKKIHVQHINNNLEALASYNRNVVYQSRNKVFCGNKIVYGINVDG